MGGIKKNLDERRKSPALAGEFQTKNGLDGGLRRLNFGLNQEESGLSSKNAPVLALRYLFCSICPFLDCLRAVIMGSLVLLLPAVPSLPQPWFCSLGLAEKLAKNSEILTSWADSVRA